MTTTRVSIPGIHCTGCASLIKDISGDFPAVQKVDVDVDTKIVSLDHDASFDMAAWKAEVENANSAYKVHSLPDHA